MSTREYLPGRTMDQLVKHFNEGYAPGYTLLAHQRIGSHLWQLAEKDGEKLIFLVLLPTAGREWCQWMPESAIPMGHYLDCPISILAQASRADSEKTQGWREEVLQEYRDMNGVRVNQVLTYGDVDYRIVELKGGSGCLVAQVSNGAAFDMTTDQIRASVLAYTPENLAAYLANPQLEATA